MRVQSEVFPHRSRELVHAMRYDYDDGHHTVGMGSLCRRIQGFAIVGVEHPAKWVAESLAIRSKTSPFEVTCKHCLRAQALRASQG